MKDSKQVFNGRTGKLILSKDGISIERNFSQAYQQKSKALTNLSYSDIESVRHRYAADKPGYIELKAKQGAGGASNISRRHQIQFDRATAHRFRRAHKKIARKLLEQELLNESGSTTVDSNQSDSLQPIKPTTDTFTLHNPAQPITTNDSSTSTNNPTSPNPPPPPPQLKPIANSGLNLPYRSKLK